jgi:hypothetical protein
MLLHVPGRMKRTPQPEISPAKDALVRNNQVPRISFLLLALAGGLVAGEIMLGYLRFLIEHQRSAILDSVDEIRSTLAAFAEPAAADAIRVTYQPRSMYAPDPYLGYASLPGSYDVTVSDTRDDTRHSFRVTVGPRGHRVTSLPMPDRHDDPRPAIWVFGNSFINGWGNDDQTTMPFFLQRYLPGRRVVNYAESGYGNIHGFLQLKKDLPKANPPPAAIAVGYADYYNERNVAASTRLQAFRGNASSNFGNGITAGPRRFLHPRARIRNGELLIDYVPLFPEEDVLSSFSPDPSLEEQYEITSRILDGMADLASAAGVRLFLAYLQGSDDDPVVAFAQNVGYTIADLRPNPDRHEWDDFRPLDSHPGPLAQSTYAWKLYRAMSSPEVTALDSKEENLSPL